MIFFVNIYANPPTNNNETNAYDCLFMTQITPNANIIEYKTIIFVLCEMLMLNIL